MPKKPKKGDLMITHIGDVNVYAILPNCPANSKKEEPIRKSLFVIFLKERLGYSLISEHPMITYKWMYIKYCFQKLV